MPRRKSQRYKKTSKAEYAYKAVKRMQRSEETKHAIVSISGAICHTVDNVGTPYYNLYNVASGAGTGSRIGEKITPTSIWANFFVHFNDPSGNSPNVYRILIYYIKGPYSGAPTANAFIQSYSSYNQSIVSPLNEDFTKRVHILYDKTFTLIHNSTEARVHRIRIPKKKLPSYIQYNDTTGAAIQMNPIICQVYSNDDTTGEIPVLNGYIHSYYKDT